MDSNTTKRILYDIFRYSSDRELVNAVMSFSRSPLPTSKQLWPIVRRALSTGDHYPRETYLHMVSFDMEMESER